MKAIERVERDGKALDLRRAGVSLGRIATELGYRSTGDADAGVRRGLAAAAERVDPVLVRELELDRLDRLQTALWPRAVKGDPVAVEKVIRLSELRVRLAGVPIAEARMVASFNETVASTPAMQASDEALIQAGRRLCEQIDASTAVGDQKASYLVPHLINVLREMGATPAARESLGLAAKKDGGGGKLAQLRAVAGNRSA